MTNLGARSAWARNGLSLLVLAGLSTSTAAMAGDGKWEYLGDDDGVLVYKKDVEGSDVTAFKGIMIADLHIGKILAVFKSDQERGKWVDRYANHEVYEKGPNEETYWIHFGLPWPVTDRDYVLNAKGRANPENRTYTVNIKSVQHPKKGEDDCCVRAEVYGTYYQFAALPGAERTRIVVEVHTDPKGLLPTWLVNMIQKDWPRKTLSNLVNRAREANRPPLPEFIAFHQATEAAPAATAAETRSAEQRETGKGRAEATAAHPPATESSASTPKEPSAAPAQPAARAE